MEIAYWLKYEQITTERKVRSYNVIAKMGKNENVSTEVLCKICKALDCQLDDIMELVEEVSA